MFAGGGSRTLHVGLARSLMKVMATKPGYLDGRISELGEMFDHPAYLDASPEVRQRLMWASSEARYLSEREYSWDHYFDHDLRPLLSGARALDLGCFSGGRSVAWAERYRLDELTGVDVREDYVAAATLFAKAKRVPARFRVACAEHLPFPDDSFDAILSFDVLEHVQNLPMAMRECRRVLRTGGRAFLVFPGYFHPWGHHLNLATRTPCLQWLFGGDTLVSAYDEIIAERGPGAEWYRRKSSTLEPWERCNSVNGMTVRGFRLVVRAGEWRSAWQCRKVIGEIGRNVAHMRYGRALAGLCHPLAVLPGLEELTLHRITWVLEK